MQIERISRQIHMHRVRGVNAERTGADGAAALNLDLLSGNRHVQVLRLLEQRIADRFLTLRAVGAQLGLGPDGIFKLVVRQVRAPTRRSNIWLPQ